LTGVVGYLDDDGRMALVKATNVKSLAYAHMRATFSAWRGDHDEGKRQDVRCQGCVDMLNDSCPSPVIETPKSDTKDKPDTVSLPQVGPEFHREGRKPLPFLLTVQ